MEINMFIILSRNSELIFIFFFTSKTAANIFVYNCLGYTIVIRSFLGRLILSN